MSLLLLSLIFITQLLSTPLYCSAFSANNLVLLRVGATGSGTALSSNYASVYLDEINPTSATTAVTSSLVSGVTLSGTDYTQGSLSLSMDKSRLYFGGTTATAGSAISLSRPYGSFTRAIVSIDSSGTSDIRTIPSTSYDGVISAICGKDSSGAWFLGNSSTIAVGYFNFDTSTWITQMDIDTSGTAYTGCGISQNGTLYLLKTNNNAPRVDFVYNAQTTGSMNANQSGQVASAPYSTKQVITNAAENIFWTCVVTRRNAADSGIFTGDALSFYSMSQMLSSPSNYRVTGIALSSDENTLYFTTTTSLFSVSSSCPGLCVPTTLRTSASNTEFRGLALVPVPTPTPAPTPDATPEPTPDATPEPTPNTTPCSDYDNDCSSCVIEGCYFCGQSSSSGTCSSSTSCSSSFYAGTASSCSAGGVTPTPSITPRPISQYTTTFYADTSCSTSAGSVLVTDRSCSAGTVAGLSREIYATLNGAGTSVSWTMYMGSSSTCSGSTVASSVATVGSCSSTVANDGLLYYYKITLSSSAASVISTPTPSVTPRPISQYTTTFYADTSCSTSAGSVLVTDRSCSAGTVAGLSREIYATLNGAGTSVSWTMYMGSSSTCSGSTVASSVATVGSCSSTVANDGLLYYYKITLSSSAASVISTPTPSVTPRPISQYTTTFYADTSCSTSAGSVLVTDRSCSAGTVAGLSREIYATLNGAGTSVSWTMYMGSSSTCSGSTVASSVATVGSCSSTVANDGLLYYYKITLSSSAASVISTPTPSVTPRPISQYTTTFYADTSCSTSAGSVLVTDRSCSAGTVAGLSREIYATLNGAGTSVSWTMYMGSSSTCSGSTVASSVATVGSCSSTVANDGLLYYYKITLGSTNTFTPTPTPSRTTAATPTASSTPPAIVQYRSTFYTDSDCATAVGSILVTDKTCTFGSISSYSREVFATLNGASNTVSWTMYTYTSLTPCSGSVVGSSTSSPVGVCSSFYDSYNFQTYYFIISLGSSVPSPTSSPTKSITSSNTRTPTITPRTLTKYVVTFYADNMCSTSAGSLTITDNVSCNSGTVAGRTRGISATLNSDGTAVAWSLYSSTTCLGYIDAEGITSLNVCSSSLANDGLTYFFKITLLGQLQPSASPNPSASSTRSVSGTPLPITSYTTTFYGDSTCSNTAGSITIKDNVCTSGTVAGNSREVRGILDATGSSVSWKMYLPSLYSYPYPYCSGTIVASGDASPLNVCSTTTASDGLKYYFKITLSGTLHPSPTPSSRPVSGYSVYIYSDERCSGSSIDSLYLNDGRCSNTYLAYSGGGSSIGNLNSDGSRVSWKAFANEDCKGEIVASADDSVINKCSRTEIGDYIYFYKVSLSGALRPSVSSSPALPAPSVPPISASDTVIVKGSLRFEGLNWASVVSSGKEDAVKKAIATELASAAKVSSDSITISSIQSVNLRSLLSLTKMRRLAGMATEVEYSIKTTTSGKDLVSTLSTGLSSSSTSGSLTSLKNAVATAAGVSPSSITVSQPRPLSVEVQAGASPTTSSTSSLSLTVIIAAAAGGGAALLIIGVVSYFLCKKPIVEKQVIPPPTTTNTVSGVNPMIVIHRKIQKKEDDEDKDEEPEEPKK
jgi:hypothetical protein